MSYHDFTDEMNLLFLFEPFDEQAERWLDTEFKRRYPGKYSIKWNLTTDHLIAYTLEFDDPKEETMFMLRYA